MNTTDMPVRWLTDTAKKPGNALRKENINTKTRARWRRQGAQEKASFHHDQNPGNPLIVLDE